MKPKFLNLLQIHLATEAYRQLPPDELWAKVRDDQDENAFRVLLEQIGSRVYQRCRSILKDEHFAEEAFQDTFRDLIRKRKSILTFHVAAAWVYQTATNHSLYLRRKKWLWLKRERNLPVAEPAILTSHQIENADEVEQLLNSLPSRYRRPIELVYWQGLTHAEVAQTLGWPKGTVDSYVALGMKKLRSKAARIGLPAVALTTILAQPARAINNVLIEHLTENAWTASTTPVAHVGSWLFSGKVFAVTAIFTGVIVTGIVIGTRHRPEQQTQKTNSAESKTSEAESLQAKNVRIAREKIANPVRDLFQKFYTSNHVVSVESVTAFGSEVEIELCVNPPPPAVTGLAAVSRGRYCTYRRKLTVYSQPTGTDRWYSMNPEKPMELNVPLPFGKPLNLTFGKEEFAAAEQLFSQLPLDDRAESELIKMLFGKDNRTFTFPTETRGISGFAEGLILVAGNSGMYHRDRSGMWKYVGECPGWFPSVSEGQVYCYVDHVICTRLLADRTAPWKKWCDEPKIEPGDKNVGRLFVAGDRLCMTIEPHGLVSRPISDPSVGWTRSPHSLSPSSVAATGDMLFGFQDNQLFKRPVNQHNAKWEAIGPWPQGCDQIIADGDRLLAFGWGPVPIYSRPLSAVIDQPWVTIGRVHDPYKR